MLATAELPISTVTPEGVTVVRHERRLDRGLAATLWFSFAMWIAYCVGGWWMLYVRHFTIYDAMTKTMISSSLVLGRDPHLGNMGYYWMPFPSFVRVPFILVLTHLGAPGMAGPMAAGLMAALTLPVLYKIGRTVDAPSAAIAIVILAYGLSPVTLFSASSAMAETTFGLFTALTVYGYVKWLRHGGVMNLAFFGVMLGGAVLSRFESLLLMPIVAVVFAIASPRGRRLPTVTIALLPGLIGFGLFSFASLVIKRDVMYWFHSAKVPTTTPDDASWLPTDINPRSMVLYALMMLLVMAPAAYAVVAGAVVDRGRFWASLGLVGFITIQPIAVVYQVLQGQSWATPRLFMYMTPLLAPCAALWLLRGPDGDLFGERVGCAVHPYRRRLSRNFGWLAVLLAPVGTVASSIYLSDPVHSSAEGEYVMLQPLLGFTSPHDPPVRSASNPVWTSDLDEFRQMVRDLESELDDGKIVAVDSLQAFPLLFSKHPDRFLLPEDRDFERILSDPIGRFDYAILLPSGNPTYGQRLIEDAVGYSGPEGTWEVWKEYPNAGKVYRWVPSGVQPGAASAPTASTLPAPSL